MLARCLAPAVAATGGGGDPTPIGTNAEQQQHAAGLHAFLMGTHEHSTGYASKEEPCAVWLLAADVDVLGLIADFAYGKQRRVLVGWACVSACGLRVLPATVAASTLAAPQ